MAVCLLALGVITADKIEVLGPVFGHLDDVARSTFSLRRAQTAYSDYQGFGRLFRAMCCLKHYIDLSRHLS